MREELPWSHEIEVAAIPPEGQQIELVADQTTRDRLSEIAGVVAVHELKAKFDLRPMIDGSVAVTGSLDGSVRQTCVVSLEDFDNPISESIAVDFAEGVESRETTEDDEEELAEDAPDPIIDGKIDLGALATEFLILSIDPYPRKPGVEFEAPEAGDAEPVAKRSPFDQLSALKDRIKKQ